MPTVFANGRSIIHSGDGLKHVAAPPDVCKTPSPGGPIPVPYVNLAFDSDLAKGAKRVKIEGSPVALESSHLSTSTGDEPGTAGGGVISSKTKGKMRWGTTSDDVRFEGKGVARFMDVTQHNGNSYNDAFQALGASGFAYADDFDGKCEICHKGPHRHRVLSSVSSARLCKQIVDALTAKGYRKRKFMVGVMICKGCDMSFATMSSETKPFFADVASGIVDSVVMGGEVSAADMLAVNRSKLATKAWKDACIKKAWAEVEEARQQRKRGYNVPGTCAGAKLMASGHAPREMTEMMFSPGGWEARYKVRWTSGGRRQRVVGATFSTDEIVASCHSCQRLLYLTNCPERSCK